MRILAIRGENIASLRHFEVDFTVEPLLSAGLYAITGPTGAGKSSLLDALCLALFLKAPRLDGVSNQGPSLDSALGSLGMHQPENLIRRGCHTGYAEVDFAGRGGHFRARWGYRASRRKGSSPQQEFSFVCLDTHQVLVQGAKSREYTDAVQQRLGWTYEQFTRAVLLAQGRFAEFLKADENARAELLEKLTGTGIYAQISSRIYARHKEEAQRLEEWRRLAGALGEQGGASPEDLEKELAQLQVQLKEAEASAESWRSLQNTLDLCAQGSESIAQLEQETAQAVASGQKAKEAHESAALQAQEAEQALKALEPEARAAELLDQRLKDQQEHLDAAQAAAAQAAKRLADTQGRQGLLQQRVLSLETQLTEEDSFRKEAEADIALAQDASMVKHLLAQYGEQHRLHAEAQDRVGKAQALLVDLAEQSQALQEAAQEATLKAHSQSPEALNAQLSEARKAGLTQDQELQALELLRTLEAQNLQQSKLQNELAEARLQEAAAASRAEAALLAYNRASLAQSADVKHLRAQLQTGSPCPVCGALEHPYAEQSESLKELAQAQMEDWKQAQALHQEAQQALSLAQAHLRTGEERQSLLTRQLQALPPLAPGHMALAYTPEQWEAYVQEYREAQQALEARLQEQLNLSLQARQSQVAADQALAKFQAAQQSLQQHEQSLSQQAQALQGTAQSLDQLLPKGWHPLWLHDALAYRRNLEAAIDSTQRKLEAYAKAREEHLSLQSELRQIGLSLKQLVLDLEASGLKLKEQQAFQQKLQAERQLLLGGAPWAPLLEAARNLAQHTSSLAQKLDADLEQQRQHFKELKAKAQARQEMLAQALSSLSAHPLYNAEWQALGYRPALDQAKENLKQLAPRLEELRKSLFEASLALRNAQERAQSLAQLEGQIREQTQIAGHWASLNALLGSADGKAFRKIAQQYTLEQLLAEANAQLAGITPRYQLQSLPGSMNFCIADAESFGEKRPVHTLSGGESFIVSLALALGLAQMAAGQLQVESLFIDEGFGTLDPETLRSVMGALASLQSQGRKVGLITHVEEMKHQIPVRIEVRKIAQGASTVHIVG